jgi:predicted transcriptional regulator
VLPTVSLRKSVCIIIKNSKANLNKQVSGELILSNAKFRPGKLAIVADILEIAKDGCKKTQIMYKANLSFTRLNEYLTSMLMQNLIVHMQGGEKEIYKTTEKGLDFLQRHNQLVNLLKR